MRYEKVTDPEIINKLFKRTKLNNVIHEFQNDPNCKVMRIIPDENEYSTIQVMQQVYQRALKRYGVANAKARIFNKTLYLIKVEESLK